MIFEKLEILARDLPKTTLGAYKIITKHPDIGNIKSKSSKHLEINPSYNRDSKDIHNDIIKHLNEAGYHGKEKRVRDGYGFVDEHHFPEHGFRIRKPKYEYSPISIYHDKKMPKSIHDKYDEHKHLKVDEHGNFPAEALTIRGGDVSKLADHKEKMHASLTKAHKPLLVGNKLTKHEEEAFKQYQHGSSVINSHLRRERPIKPLSELKHHSKYYNGDDNPEYKHAQIHHLDSAIAKHAMPHDTIAFRGIDDATAKKLKPGKVVKKRAYTSTTVNAKTATNFNGNNVMHIHIPKGHPAAYLEHHDTENRKEHEVLLPRNTHMKIHKVEHIGNKKIIYAHVLPHTHEEYHVKANANVLI